MSSPPAGYYYPQSAAGLLSTEERVRTLVRIWENTSLPKETYQALCLAPLQACAEVMRQFPYSNAGRFAYPGGMLDATLKTLLYAVMKARSYMLPPGVPPEDQARDSAAWNTVVFYAALFSHLSALGSLKVELDDGSVWIPFDGQPASAYRFRFVPPGMAGADICLGGAVCLEGPARGCFFLAEATPACSGYAHALDWWAAGAMWCHQCDSQ
ncbi:TraI domain-containing protein [Erwinia tracheiphila]|uniref:TraI domain-containing protein n=1 Tax=Erwinia tracheiphila TaxID=65700 RepID=UPI001F459D88|nr:TraI domain-containing protein [Erwinia tracheiphila]UIA83300.1 TraI domain-containing protein [Erwinia tracheiphila]UIA91879.1 TraI domain-containing protein [Erwinia tracheiphila]